MEAFYGTIALMGRDITTVILHNRLGSLWPIWAVIVGVAWFASGDGNVAVVVIVGLQVVFTATRCPWRTVLSSSQARGAEARLDLGPFGLVHRTVQMKSLRVRINLIEGRPRSGLPVPYWLSPLMPWSRASMRRRLQGIGIETD